MSETNIHKTSPTFTPTPTPIPTTESIFKDYFFKCLLLGAPGAGKTRTACLTLPPEMYPIAVIDIDNKAEAMPELIPLRQAGHLDIFPINAPLLANIKDYKNRFKSVESPPSIQPQGLLQCVDVINAILRGGNDIKKYKTLIIDPLSRLSEHVERIVEFIMKKGTLGVDTKGGGMGGDWRKYESIHAEFVNTTITTAKINIIMTCHLHEKDGPNGLPIFSPAIMGGMKGKLLSYFDNAFFLRTRTGRAGKLNYVMHTRKTDNVPARTNIPGLDDCIDQDLTYVVNLWKQHMLGKMG